MKKWLWVLVGILVFSTTVCFAEVATTEAKDTLVISEEVNKIPLINPVFNQGMMYEFVDCELSYISTVQLTTYKNFSLEAGYSTADNAVVVISYPVLKLKDLGVTVPILDLVECNLGVGAGIGRIGGDNEPKFGVTLTLIKVKI